MIRPSYIASNANLSSTCHECDKDESLDLEPYCRFSSGQKIKHNMASVWPGCHRGSCSHSHCSRPEETARRRCRTRWTCTASHTACSWSTLALCVKHQLACTFDDMSINRYASDKSQGCGEACNVGNDTPSDDQQRLVAANGVLLHGH